MSSKRYSRYCSKQTSKLFGTAGVLDSLPCTVQPIKYKQNRKKLMCLGPATPWNQRKSFFDTPSIYAHGAATATTEKFQSAPQFFRRRSPAASTVLPSEQLQPNRQFELGHKLRLHGRPLGLRIGIILLDGTRLSFFFRNCYSCTQGKHNTQSKFPQKITKKKQVQIRGAWYLLPPCREKIVLFLLPPSGTNLGRASRGRRLPPPLESGQVGLGRCGLTWENWATQNKTCEVLLMK
jgi:hypothetical protein